MTARFFFQSPEFSFEVQGPPEFVSEQVALVRTKIQGLLGVAAPERAIPAATPPAAPAEAAPAPTAPAAGVTALEQFYGAASAREGRGALQDSILIFAYYMQEKQNRPEFSIEDLNHCFQILSIRPPKSLANTLGILKRDRRLLQSGSRRGTYALSEKGLQRAKRCIGA